MLGERGIKECECVDVFDKEKDPRGEMVERVKEGKNVFGPTGRSRMSRDVEIFSIFVRFFNGLSTFPSSCITLEWT